MLLPNKHNKSLDIFRIPLSPITVPPSPILRLNLPALPEGSELNEIACRSEPSLIRNASRLRKSDRDGSPTTTGPASHPPRAFVATAKNAICLFSLRIAVHGFTFVVHRNALCTLVDDYVKSDSEESEDGQKSKENDEDHVIVPWADWGPPITRWFNTTGYSGGWITTSAGQRYVLMPHDWSLSGVPIYVLDFNEENLRKMKRYYGDREDETMVEVEVGSARQLGPVAASLERTNDMEMVEDDEEEDEWETDSEYVPYIFSFHLLSV